MAGHVWTRDATALAFYTWHVPVFFFLAGWFWSPARSMRTELTKRWRTLGKPYVAWVVILFAITCVLLVADRAEPARLLGGLWGGAAALQPFTTVWFVSVLFFTVVIYRAISRLPLVWHWMIGGLGSVLGAFVGPELAATPLSAGSALPCLVFLLAGTALRHATIPRPWAVALIALAVSAALIITRVSAPMDIKFGDYGSPLLSSVVAVAISYALVVFATIVYERFPSLSPATSEVARIALVIVLLHPVLLYMPGPDSIRMVTAVLVPTVIGLLWMRSPMSEWLTGQPRSANRSARAVVAASPAP